MKILFNKRGPLFRNATELTVEVMNDTQVKIGDHIFTVESLSADSITKALKDILPDLDFTVEV